ncbi:MAG: site-specific DNA-methyltransferase [Myxococcota bacterium]
MSTSPARGGSLARLQALLRDLFQLDLSDLDFGIYKLLRLEREEIERFLGEQLPDSVEKAFQASAGKEREGLVAEVERLAGELREQVGPDALAADGSVTEQTRGIPAKVIRELVERYEAAGERLDAVRVSEQARERVYNHLYAFFSRYYEDGDFIPKRRFGRRETYAVPWNGEEVVLHWANKGQHYVKTGENFRDYAFAVPVLFGGGPEARVRFVLDEATEPPGNTKGDRRYYFPRPEGVTWDAEARELRVPFGFRLPSVEEAKRWGKGRSLDPTQVLDSAESPLLDAVPESSLKQALAARESEEAPTELRRHMNRFIRRRTTDYFVHQDLGGFLRGELEFYLKDAVLGLGDLEAGPDGLAAKLREVRVLKTVAEDLVTFLAQLEDVQLALFEKRKLVLRTDWLVPVKDLPEAFWPEVCANDRQLARWRELYALEPERDLLNPEGEVNEAFLRDHPTLVVETALFDRDFTWRVLESIEDLDEQTDGVLVHGENYQALRLLEGRFGGEVEATFVDPPYNTGGDGFLYRDRYQHSSWLAMVTQRMRAARTLLAAHGTYWCTIDDGEVHRLRFAASDVFGEQNFVANVVWEKKYTRANDATWFSDNHDHVLVFAADRSVGSLNLQPRNSEQTKAYKNPDDHPKGPWKATPLHAKSGSARNFSYTFQNGVTWSPPAGTYPRYSEATLQRLEAGDEIWFGRDGSATPARKTFLRDAKQGVTPITIWSHKEVGHNHEARDELKALFPGNPFSSPKPTRLLTRVLELASSAADGRVLDYFAGSGTTGHAVINLNRDDGGRRRFLLVEHADYFDTVLLPRIAKVIYSPEWKDGEPKRKATAEEAERSPRLVKVVRIESYEDALHNLTTEDTRGRATPRAEAHKAADENAYPLRYVARLHAEASPVFLQLDRLAHPFDYAIERLTDAGPVEAPVDLVETFNLLYGLRVRSVERWENPQDGGRTYRVVRGDRRDGDGLRRVVVVWRDMSDLDPAVERAFLEERLDGVEADEVLVNGDCAAKGTRSLDGLFRRLVGEVAEVAR